MEVTQEWLKGFEAELAATRAAKMEEDLTLKGSEELLDLYRSKLAEVEAATSTVVLERAQRDVEIIKEAILARMF